MIEQYVLDTNLVFDILNQQTPVVEQYRELRLEDATLLMCPVVHFEVVRGFVHRPDPEDERAFAVLTARWRWEDLERSDWQLACELWAEGERKGRRPGDADVLLETRPERDGWAEFLGSGSP